MELDFIRHIQLETLGKYRKQNKKLIVQIWSKREICLNWNDVRKEKTIKCDSRNFLFLIVKPHHQTLKKENATKPQVNNIYKSM